MNKQIFEYVKQAALKAGYEDEMEKMAASITAIGRLMNKGIKPNANMFPKMPPKLNTTPLSQVPIRVVDSSKIRNSFAKMTQPATPTLSPKITRPVPRFNPRMEYNGDRWSFLTKS